MDVTVGFGVFRWQTGSFFVCFVREYWDFKTPDCSFATSVDLDALEKGFVSTETAGFAVFPEFY